MKKKMGSVLAVMTFALLGLSLAQSAQADHVRARDVLALQEDLDYLDDSLALLNARQQQRFQARIDALRTDVTDLRSRMNDPATWRTHVTTKQVADLRARVATLQTEVERAATRRASGTASGTRYGREIPAGTVLDVRLDQTVSSKTSRVEERVEATTVNPVTVNGRTVVPTGTVVIGHVAEVDDADRGQRDGRIRLEFTSLQFPDGTRADIRSSVTSVEEKHTGTSTKKRAGLGAILGGVLGGIIEGRSGALIGAVIGAGGAVVGTRGQNVELPEGTHLALRLDQATVLATRAPSAQADQVRTRDVLALQEDLNHLDDSLALLNARQQQPFQARIDALRTDVTDLRSRMTDPATWRTHVTTKQVADLRARVATLQTEVERASTRRASGTRYGREIPAGTMLDVRLDQTVSSKSSRVEERIEATTVSAVTLNGRTVVPVGTVVIGHVAEVDDADRGQRDGRIRLEFTSLQFPDGTRADIRSSVTSLEGTKTGTSTSKRAGLGAILGGVLGGIIEGKSGALIGAVIGAGGAVVGTRGQNVELPEGTHLTLRLDQATVLASR